MPFPSSLTISGARPTIGVRDRDLDWELAVGSVPFASFDDLLKSLGFSSSRSGNDSSGIEVHASSPAAFSEGTQIENGHATVELQIAMPLDVTKVRLGLEVGTGPRAERGCVSGGEMKWQEHGGLQIARHGIEGVMRVQAYLSYSGVLLDQKTVADPDARLNQRALVHQTIDPDLQMLERALLNVNGSKTNDFELAVSALLHLLGFSTCCYGQLAEFRDGPDIIAVPPSGHLAVIECTTGALDHKGKLSKLAGRAVKIRKRLHDAGHDKVQVLPVIVTSLVREEVKVDYQNARKYRIVVVCREELEQWLKQVPLQPDANKIYEWATSSLPDEQQAYFGRLSGTGL